MLLDELLARSGLDPGLRLLVATEVCAADGDLDALEQALRRARQLGVPRAEVEETLLQGVLFYGFPRSVSAFACLAEVWPVSEPPTGGGLPREDWPDAGRRLFDSIYARNAPSVHAMLGGFHRELHDFVLESAYGRILSRPGLDPRRRELLAVGALAALDQIPQLIAHARGARRFGATATEVRETLVTAVGDLTVVDEHLRRIDG